MAKLVANGLTMHYQQAGAGPDVVLIHGLTGDLSHWYVNFIPGLSPRYRVTAYDLRGHGYTDLPRSGYDTATLADDLRALLDALRIPAAYVVGHSYGGSVAMALAARAPERFKGLALYDAGFPVLRRLRQDRDWPGWEQFGPELAKLGIFRDSPFDDPTWIIERCQSVSVPFGLRAGLPRTNRRVLKLLKETEAVREAQEVAGLTEEALASVRVPVLAIYGRTSPVVQVGHWLSEHVPGCRLELLSDSAHFFLMQRPEASLDSVLRFLDERTGAT